MKKWIAGSLLVIAAFLTGIYALVPQTLQFTAIAGTRCPGPAATRFIGDATHWTAWWPGDTAKGFSFNNYHFTLNKRMYNAYEVLIVHNTDTAVSNLILLPFGRDSVQIRWTAAMQRTNNPMTRISQYRKMKGFKEIMALVQQKLCSFLGSSKHLYGINIQLTTLRDTTLIATKMYSRTYPTTEGIYSMIGGLKTYIATAGAKETNYPMLNVREDSKGFLTMVAIPTDRELKAQGPFFTRRMIIIKDNTLLMETTGGTGTVKNAYRSLGLYMQDYRYGAPAIPFESLVTDRSKEADTSKWVTRIFAPIM